MFGNRFQVILPTPPPSMCPFYDQELKKRTLFSLFLCKIGFHKVKKVNPIIEFIHNDMKDIQIPQQQCSLRLHSISIKKENSNLSAAKKFSDCSLNNCDYLLSMHSNDDNQSDCIKSIIIPKSPVLKESNSVIKLSTAKVSVENSPTFIVVDTSIDDIKFNKKLLISKYPMFHMKHITLTPQDYIHLKTSWQLVIDENLYYFKNMKKQNIICKEKTALSWFYDVFYETVYTYDAINNTTMTKILKHNLKIQAHVLTTIVNNCINFVRNYKINQTFDYSIMFHAHDKIGIKYNHYIIIFETLMATFDRCLRLQWTREMEFSWCKTISIVLRNILPHYRAAAARPPLH